MRVGMSGIPAWKIMLAGLLHDAGKCGLFLGEGLRPRYVLTTGGCAGYTVQRTFPEFTVRDLSAMYAAAWNCPWDVVQAILTHDGLYCPQNAPYIDNMSNLSLLLMNADNLQSKIFETKTKAFLALAEGPEAGADRAAPGQGDRIDPLKARRGRKAPGKP
jgi:HD-like signal output (HDOD) protein